MFVRVLYELFFDIFFERRITRERMIAFKALGVCCVCFVNIIRSRRVFERSPNAYCLGYIMHFEKSQKSSLITPSRKNSFSFLLRERLSSVARVVSQEFFFFTQDNKKSSSTRERVLYK